MKMTFSKKILFWAGSFVLVGVYLVVRQGMPLLPLLCAGLLTLAITLFRHFSQKSR
jgi:hypothetical protein